MLTRPAVRAARYWCVLCLLIMLTYVESAPADKYNPCFPPPMVSFGAKPNLMVVMDYSASMQYPAYWQYYNGWDKENFWDGSFGGVQIPNPVASMSPYDRTKDYYGIFDSGKFYEYVPYSGGTTKYPGAGPGGCFQESATYSFASWGIKTTERQADDQTIKVYTSVPHDLTAGDVVRITGLNSHTFLNNLLFRVESVLGDSVIVKTFRAGVITSWNEIPDTTGQITRKTELPDSSTTPVQNVFSGDILNWAITSRIDAAQKVLFGGKWEDEADSNFTHIRAQGAKRLVTEGARRFNILKVINGNTIVCDSIGDLPFLKGELEKGSVPKVRFISNAQTGTLIQGDPVTVTAVSMNNGGSIYLNSNYPNFTISGSVPANAVAAILEEGSSDNVDLLHAGFHVVPGVEPNTYDKKGTDYSDYHNGWDLSKDDVFLTVGNYSRGTLLANRSFIMNWGPMGNNVRVNADIWEFTVPPNTRVQIHLEQGDRSVGKDGDERAWNMRLPDPFLIISKKKPTIENNEFVVPANADWAASNDDRGEPGNLNSRIVADLPAATYYVIATQSWRNKMSFETDNGQGQYVLLHNLDMNPVFSGSRGNVAGYTRMSKIGNLFGARVRLRTEKNKREGVIHKTVSQVRWGLTTFGPSEQLQSICKELRLADVDSFAQKFTSTFPGGGTPTDKGLLIAQNYFKGTDGNTSKTDSTKLDPFYRVNSSGAAEAVPCRKNAVLLITDGLFGSDDPVKPVYDMHSTDLRPELNGTQNVDTYSIFAFGNWRELASAQENEPNPKQGPNSMKAVAMFGGYKKVRTDTGSLCGSAAFPFPETSLPKTKSLDFSWPVAKCDPLSSDYDSRCCQEWDRVKNGEPDNYFEVSDGAELEQSINRIVAGVTQGIGAASAVATMQSGIGIGDVIVRGAFDAVDPDQETNYLWFGHLEAYWPYKDSSGKQVYDFEFPENQGKLCWQITAGSQHCWDAADFMRSDESLADNRVIFTYSEDLVRNAPGFPSDKSKPPFMHCPYPCRPFTTAKITKADLDLPSSANEAYADDLVKWVRGKNTGADVSKFRERGDQLRGKGWILGDIVYSTPVVVGAPPLGAVPKSFADTDSQGNSITVNDYLKWRASTGDPENYDPNCGEGDCKKYAALNIRNRDTVAYVGANDGMLHAFLLAKNVTQTTTSAGKKETKTYILSKRGPLDVTAGTHPDIGKELWAYIPSNLLSELQYLASKSYGVQDTSGVTCAHRAMVDLSPQAYHLFFQSDKSWHTVLIGGERGGGDVYFAIDVTDPHTPKILWEYSVLKDLVVRFDYVRATPAFKDACGDVSYHPGEFPSGKCEVPLVPSAVFQGKKRNSRCNGCSPENVQDCSNDKSCCALLKKYTGENYFKPFSEPAVYDEMKIIPMSWSKPAVGRLRWHRDLYVCTQDPHKGEGGLCGVNCKNDDTDSEIKKNNNRNIAFVGVGLREMTKAFDYSNEAMPKFFTEGFRGALEKPLLLGLDVEYGINLFRYIWPSILDTANKNTESPVFPSLSGGCARGNSECNKSSTTVVPYAMADAIALDLWNNNDDIAGEDGYIDRLYVGDLNGVFYGLNFNFDDTPPSNPNPNWVDKLGLLLNVWYTKPIESAQMGQNVFRSDHQPITAAPAVSYESGPNANAIRVIFGTGRFDRVDGTKSDKTDDSRMSIYNLREEVARPVIDPNSQWGGYVSSSPLFKFQIVKKCAENRVFRCKEQTDCCNGSKCGCNWVKEGSNKFEPDCCENQCNNPCWNCVFDLVDPGERIINKPLIAGGFVFITSMKPSDNPCAGGGESFLYVLDYQCRPFPEGLDPLSLITDYSIQRFHVGQGAESRISGERLSLGLGIASQPVLSTAGDRLFIQMSGGEIFSQRVRIPPPKMKGWSER